METQLAASAERRTKFLIFRLARQSFAIDATTLRGLIPLREVTLLEPADPRQSMGIRGFAAMSGCTFPVVDISERLAVAKAERGKRPCVVVMEVGTRDGRRLVGFIADRASDLVTPGERDIQNGFLRMPTGKPRRVLDPDRLLGSSESVSAPRDGRSTGKASL